VPVVRDALSETGSSARLVAANPNLRRVNLALLGSLVGDGAYSAALAVYAFRWGGAPAVGAYGAIRFGLTALTVPFLVTIAERLPRRRVLVGLDLLRVVLVVGVALLVLAGGPPVLVLVVSGVVGLVGGPFRPVQAALTPSLVSSPRELAAANGVSSTLESLAFFADSVDDLVAAGVDAVAVSTPAGTHSAVTDDLLRRGVPVVCDKPFALTAADARRSVELAEREGVLLSPYQNRRWDSDLLTVRRVLEEGRLGAVRRFESAFERWAPDPNPPAAGGGLLRDFGSHLVDQALFLFGPAERVYAETHEVAPEAEDSFEVLLQHAGGMRSQLSGGWRQSAPRPRFRVSGDAGTFVVTTAMDGQEAALVAGRDPAGEGEEWGREAEADWGTLHLGDEREPVPSERGRWDAYYAQFAAAVRGEGAVPVDPWDAVATATVIDAARRSAADGVTVDVEPVVR
jgi:predicted dehydrogenase